MGCRVDPRLLRPVSVGPCRAEAGKSPGPALSPVGRGALSTADLVEAGKGAGAGLSRPITSLRRDRREASALHRSPVVSDVIVAVGVRRRTRQHVNAVPIARNHRLCKPNDAFALNADAAVVGYDRIRDRRVTIDATGDASLTVDRRDPVERCVNAAATRTYCEADV
jgi:hypothetical protein